MADGGWHYIAFTIESDGMARMYVDGVEEQSMVLAVPTEPGAPLTIGHAKDPIRPSEGFDGIIDEVRISDRARRAEEIRAYYVDSLAITLPPGP